MFQHSPPKSAPSTQKAKKKDGPKKPATGYMLFVKEMRPQVKEEFPDLSFGEYGKKLGAMWRALDEKTKENYKAGKAGGKA